MALERSATGNDAALCPLPAPQGWRRGTGGSISIDGQAPKATGGHRLKPSSNQDC